MLESKDMAEESGMSFWEHLDDLRKIIFRIVLCISVLSVAFFTYMGEIFDRIILYPASNDFYLYRWLNELQQTVPFLPDFSVGEFHVNIININLSSPFFIHLSTSFGLAFVFSFPFVVYQLFLFVKPALYANERKNIRAVFFLGNLLFFAGVLVGYLLVFPLTLRFLAGYQISLQVENSLSIDSYMDNFTMLCLLMGIVFELPLLSYFLSRLGILHRSFFNKYRRHAIVILLVLAAFITPSGDPFTLMVVFLPIYMLWEISAFITKGEKGILIPGEIPD